MRGFLEQCYKAISISTPHLYLSLVWIPESSKLQEIWGKEVSKVHFLKEPIRHPSQLLFKIDCPAKFDIFAVSPNDRFIASGSRDGRINAWDLVSGSLVSSTQVPVKSSGKDYEDDSPARGQAPIDAIGYASGEKRILYICGGSLFEMDGDTSETRKVSVDLDGVRCMAISNNSEVIAVGLENGTIAFLEGKSWSLVNRWGGAHDHAVNTLAFSTDGLQLASGADDDNAFVWDVAFQECLIGHLAHSDPVTGVAFSRDGRRLLTSTWDCVVRLWDLDGNTYGQEWQSDNRILFVSFSSDGSRIITAVQIYGHEKSFGLDEGVLLPPPSEARTHYWYTDSTGRRYYRWPTHASIQVWDSDVLFRPRTMSVGHTDDVNCVAFSPDGTRIASASYDHTVRVWDAHTGAPVEMAEMRHGDGVWFLAFSPDGKQIASSGGDEVVRVWDAQTGEAILEPLKGHRDTVTHGCYSPDGTRIITGAWDGRIIMWDASTGGQINMPISAHEGVVEAIAFAPDGSCFASAGYYDKSIRFWDGNTGEALGEPLDCPSSTSRSIAFSPDSTRFAVGARFGNILLGNVQKKRLTGDMFEGHNSDVNSISFSPDGTRIYSASEDKTIRCWDAHSGKPLGRPLLGHSNEVNTLSVSHDGKHIVTGSDDKTIRIWNSEVFDWEVDGSIAACGLRGPDKIPLFIPDDGWISTPNGDLLLWIPDEHRSKVCDVSSICISADDGVRPIRILWDKLHHGEDWTRIREEVE